ncbi:hypothetical protein H0H93_003204 [Arthromyces matolae]|nr:hypothetical protein H0H93_003204 [Arthromyces matolae]
MSVRRSPSRDPYAPNPESLILPDGPVREETVELLEELVLPTPEQEGDVDVDADYHLRREHHKTLPWYKTPSPFCVLKPDIFHRSNPITFPALPPTISNIILASSTNFVEGATCASDPSVQAAVAKLAAVYTTSLGILSCITGGWWGSYSDRHGRTRLLALSVIGLLYADFNFIFIARNFQRLPGGYWLLIIGPIVEGVTATTAAMTAYAADTTTESARSRTLSLALGLLFTGMAVGPSLGALCIHITGTPITVFYASFGIHLVYAFIVCLLLPESLLKSQMERSRVAYEAELQNASQTASEGTLVMIKRIFSFLSPLSVFFPEIHQPGPGDNPLKRKKRDWSLTMLVGSYGFAISIMVCDFAFAGRIVGFNIVARSEIPRRGAPHSATFDLRLAQASLFLEVISYAVMALAPTALVFTGSTILTSLGAGLNPALQSVALALYRRRGGTESGKLFGAMSVVQALSGQIISPAMYGFVYSKTVATFPRGIFVLTVVAITFAFVLLAFVRLPRKTIRTSTDVEDRTPTAADRE